MPPRRGVATRLAAGADTGVGEIVPASKRKKVAASKPDPTPPDMRYVPPGHVLLEWVGDHGPLAYAKLRAGAQMGIIPKELLEVWEIVADRTMWFTRIPYVFRREMHRDRDGVSQDYCWGPDPTTYVQEVTIKDADHLLSGPNGHEFRVLNYEGTQPADWDPITRFVTDPLRDSVGDAQAEAITEKVRAIVIKEKQTQALRGVEYHQAGKNRMVRTGRGAWTPTE